MIAADDVVSAWVHEAWCGDPRYPCPACLGELQARIGAALAIHRPCHTSSVGPYSGCPCGQRQAGRPAVCEACTRGGHHEPWPCPTVRALGAVTP